MTTTKDEDGSIAGAIMFRRDMSTTNAPPVYYAPRPVVVYPAPSYYEPAPVYYPPPGLTINIPLR
jgi:hypothetical protein